MKNSDSLDDVHVEAVPVIERQPAPMVPVDPEHLLLKILRQNDFAYAPKEGLICGSVGYYRLLDKIGDDGKILPKKVLVFAFHPEHLDVTEHAELPGVMVLKNPLLSFPLTPKNEPFLDEWILTAVKNHQEEWITFIHGFGNLYPHPIKDEGDLFYNKFIAYHIRKNEKSGKYYVSYRLRSPGDMRDVTIHDKRPGKLGRLQDWIANDPVIISEEFDFFDEAKNFMHRDFCVRYEDYLEGLEPQSWQDKDVRHSMAMWFQRRVSAAVDDPVEAASKLARLLVMGFSPIDGIKEVAQEAFSDLIENDEKTRNLARLPISEVADVDSKCPVAHYRFRPEVVNEWAAYTSDQIPEGLPSTIPLCHDVQKRRLEHAISVSVCGPHPCIVTHHGSTADGQWAVSVQRPSGVKSYHTSDHATLVVHTAHHMFDPSAPTENKCHGLSPFFAPLFKPDHVACISHSLDQEAMAALGYEEAGYLAPPISSGFVSVKAAYEKIAMHCGRDMHGLMDDDKHCQPQFIDDEVSEAKNNSWSWKNASFKEKFDICMKEITKYRKLMSPLKYKKNLDSLGYAGAWAAAAMGCFFIPTAHVCIIPSFALAARSLTKRFKAYALSDYGKKALALAGYAGVIAGVGICTGVVGWGLIKKSYELFSDRESWKDPVLLACGAGITSVDIWRAKKILQPKKKHFAGCDAVSQPA